MLLHYCSSDDECYSTKALKLKLDEDYGKHIVVSNETSKEAIYFWTKQIAF